MQAMEGTFQQVLSRPAASQHASPLFHRLPGEIRSQIFAFTLADFPNPDPDRQYDLQTCYSRPSYFAPRKSDVRLLRSCRAVLKECWHMPFMLREQVHYLTNPNRSPPGFREYTFRKQFRRIVRWRQSEGGEMLELNTFRIFAQMFRLEEEQLTQVLETPCLYPRSVTLTIRHADWWYWEDDQPLSFDGRWVKAAGLAMADSVREFHIELESLERKKGQVDAIARQMTQTWFFKKRDGTVLYPDATPGSPEVTRWRGTSTWHGRRWVRDETEPDKIDYYVATVSFRREHVVERAGGRISPEARAHAARDKFEGGLLKLTVPDAVPIQDPEPSIEATGAGREYV